MKDNTKCFRIFKPNPKAKIRLFCFHHSGGSASAYFQWVKHISSKIELIAAQFPGREDRFTEPLINRLEDIISSLCEEFDLYKDKPFFVFGHSLGALVGFEFINAIKMRYSMSPSYLIVSAARAPHLTDKRAPLSQLNDHLLLEKLKEYNGLNQDILFNTDLLSLFLPIIKSDFQLLENYHYHNSEPLFCDLLAFSGDDDQTVNQEDISAWSTYTKGNFQHLSFAGKHFFLKDHEKIILQTLNQIGENTSTSSESSRIDTEIRTNGTI